MSVAEDLARWVENKPLVLVRFDEAFSESLRNSKHALERFTFTQPHTFFDNVKLPTLCLVEMQEYDSVKCYVGVAKNKTAVSTHDSRMTVIKLRQIHPSSLSAINERISEKRYFNALRSILSRKYVVSLLSPKLSANIVRLLSNDRDNQKAFEVVIGQLPKLRPVANVNWAQENAIQTALTVFGIEKTAIPLRVSVKSGTSSALSLVRAHILEDNVIGQDASDIPGFSLIEKDVTGRAVFVRGDERLEVYTANRGPLEKMLGVDLIYVNETRGNIVMIQYKMLEEEKGKSSSPDWVFRPDQQTKDEIGRMNMPESKSECDDYRLNRNPFYFKFVKRKIDVGSHKSFLISLEHLNLVVKSPKAKGPRGGIRLSYDALDGTYLRETDIISLIRSGYIGTHRVESDALKTIIAEVSKGDKAIVLAWQRKIQQRNQES